MNLIRSNRGNLVGILIIFLLFMGSIYARRDKLDLPPSSDFEWITHHTLITCEIWDQAGGPQHFAFNPVYSYPGKGNKAIAAFGGVMDKKGDQYYVSYPPFAFIYAYYSTKLFGGPDVYSLRTNSLIIHFFCTLLLYLIIRKIGSVPPDKISIAAIFGGFLYLFSTGTLWSHSILYFSDMLVQLFVMLSIYLFVRLLKKDYKKSSLLMLAIGIGTFLGCYTEWLAVFWAFFSGLSLIILYLVKKESVFLKAFLIIGISSVLAVSLTLFQYSSIDGFDHLKEVSLQKYEQRSGYSQSPEDTILFTVNDDESWDYLYAYFERNFGMVILLRTVFILLLLPILIWHRKKLVFTDHAWKILILFLLFLSIGLHYILFFNFNAIHEFANLKTGFFFILLISFIVLTIEQIVNKYARATLAMFVIFIGSVHALKDYRVYRELYSYGDFNFARIHSAEIINEYEDPDQYVFVNVPTSAGYLYLAKRMMFPVNDLQQVKGFMGFFKVDEAQYFHHEGDTLKYLEEYQLMNDSLIVKNKINF
ncbi:MAG: hypothetical protein H6582_12680 [Crocinitomicaceae bacterium]|nr:hypothetical protein [Crocinitomicaceae bacterium]